jgi:hypothetical protein
VADSAAETVAEEMLAGAVEAGSVDGLRYFSFDGDGNLEDFDTDAVKVALQSEVSDALAPSNAPDRETPHANSLFTNSDSGGNGEEKTTTAGTLADHRENDRGPERGYGDQEAAERRADARQRQRELSANSRSRDPDDYPAGTLKDYRERQQSADGDGVTDHDPAAGPRSGVTNDFGFEDLGTNSSSDDGDEGDHSAGYGTLREYRNSAASEADDSRRVGVVVKDGVVRSNVVGGGTSEKPPTHLKRNGYPKERGSHEYALVARELRREGRWGSWSIPGEDSIGN